MMVVSSLHVFTPELLQRAGLGTEQIAAVVAANDMKENGDYHGARMALVTAGINLEMMQQLRVQHRFEQIGLS